jgi:hypothetical protein
LTGQDIRLLRAVDTADKKEMSYEIYHDVLAMPILDWRIRYRRSRRIALVLLPLLLLLAMIFMDIFGEGGGLYVIFYITSCLIPMIFGFLIGRGWARAR